ncbi:DnaA regulatory inactivator Hda [Candidatus Aalborgicola defluviihabitans]|uniref:DnaA regulatory inactivator Hda n=1 Tax=Candidatus Aalborgicola defluviihabitans TaxID=3386187 RepID=UPI001D5CF945|nr:DnaA regulatory inactivator Hda [Burkholderiales bacterium]MBK7281087.1 DnaA regulatory inactivator Hda [Burkholderiales bacterium]
MKQIALDIGLPTGPTLANFCAGPNEAALRHMELWVGAKSGAGAELPTRSPVPTYFWGASGSGKSHLLKAAREALREQGARVGWLDAGVLEPAEFSESWAAVVLDDVHLYTAQQQHMAFNWFVNAQTHQRPVLAAGEYAPIDLKLRDDLRTRLGWGHVFNLQPLSEPERRAVLRKAADARGVFLSDEVMDFMLTRFSRDLGSLMELLELMDGYALQTQRAITVPLIKSMMDNH